MATATLTTTTVGAECLDADLALNRSGVWTAHLDLSGDVSPIVGDSAVITLAGEQPGQAETFTGTVRRSEPWQARTRTVIVGGAGGLRRALPPRDHVAGVFPVTAILVAQGIATASGETLAASVSDHLDGIGFPSWRRSGAGADGLGGEGVEALDVLVAAIVAVSGSPAWAWRILSDGTLWIGEDTWPLNVASIGETWIDDGDDGRIDCAPPIASLRPGTTITTSGPRLAERVTYRVTAATARCEVLYPVRGDIAASPVPEVYGQSHAASVVAQNTDGSLDVQCDDPRLAGLRKVPFCPGIVGCRLVVAAGRRVRVAFTDGSPAGAYAYGLDMDPAATAGVARGGDPVPIGVLQITPPSQLVFTPDPIVGGPPQGPSATVTLYAKINPAGVSTQVFIR